MLQVSNISKSFGDNSILENVFFTVNAGDRLGLIGPNGCGKTTLLRIITGDERPDDGAVSPTLPDLRLGYLEQGLIYGPGDTLADLLQAGRSELELAEARVAQLAQALAQAADSEQASLMEAYSGALAELEGVAARQTAAYDAESVLAGLGLEALPLDTPVATLSGGQKTRLGLARLLLQDPHLLLLDEPTNHLDIQALEWLEEWLARYRGGALIVSHDRTFLDCTITTVLEIDPATHRLTAYPGNYTDYLEVKVRRREKQWAAYKDQQQRIARLQAGVRRLSDYAGSIERGTIDYSIRKIAKGIARRAVVQRRRLERELEEERLDRPGRSWQMKLEFPDVPASGQDVILLEELAAGYDGVPLFSGVNQVLRAGERVALVGPNGEGKTTLLRVINGQLEPLAGRVRLGANVRLGYYAQEQENLDPDSTPYETIRGVAALSETDTRSFLHYFLFAGDEVFLPIGDLSYGERARLVLARLVATGCNCLLLDEPINHLDIPSRARFEQAMAAFEGTVLAVVHDRYFIRQFAGRIWSLAGGTLTSYFDLDQLRAHRG
jgi:ATP-binding cassette subfamily F protein 3